VIVWLALTFRSVSRIGYADESVAAGPFDEPVAGISHSSDTAGVAAVRHGLSLGTADAAVASDDKSDGDGVGVDGEIRLDGLAGRHVHQLERRIDADESAGIRPANEVIAGKGRSIARICGS
jgi:hypothetical protein